MSEPPRLVLHVLPPSHPCHAVEAALRLKGLEFERVDLVPGAHVQEMERLYGEGRTTVPGLTIGDEERVHGSNAIFERLEDLRPDPPLFPSQQADAVREAARWGDEELQDLGRRIPWGALHFRPEAMGTFAGPGAPPLDPKGTDYAIKALRQGWRYHGITAERLAGDLAGLPAKLDHVDGLIADGLLGGEAPNAADLQIGSTLGVLLTVGDVRPLIEARPCGQLALRLFGRRAGDVPAGAFPAGWVPAA